MKNILQFVAFTLVMLFASCEEKPVIIPMNQNTITTDNVILIEELTGVECPNCPTGTATIKEIARRFPGNVVVVNIHGILQTTPLETSRFDFRNDFASDLELYLKPFLGKPAAYFNRVQFDDVLPEFGSSFFGSWQGYAEEELNRPHRLDLIINNSFDEVTREVFIEVSATPVVNLNGDFNLSIMFTESKIIDAQEDQTTIIADYEHNNVLRTMITKFDGDFFASDMSAGEPISRSYTYTLPDDGELWIPTNMNIVAFVSDVTGNSKAVIQATESNVAEE